MQVEIIDNSKEVLEALHSQLKTALEAVGMQAEANAKIEVTRAVYDTPESKSGYRRTGNLRNGISHAHDDTTAYVGTNVEYAAYVEMGTSKMAARPFIRPAVENYMDEYKALAEEMLRS